MGKAALLSKLGLHDEARAHKSQATRRKAIAFNATKEGGDSSVRKAQVKGRILRSIKRAMTAKEKSLGRTLTQQEKRAIAAKALAVEVKAIRSGKPENKPKRGNAQNLKPAVKKSSMSDHKRAGDLRNQVDDEYWKFHYGAKSNPSKMMELAAQANRAEIESGAARIWSRPYSKKSEIIFGYSGQNVHKKQVERALDRGEKVPADVLKQYPDLAEKKPKVEQQTASPSRELAEQPHKSIPETKRLRTLKDSLEKKQEAFDSRLDAHIQTVKQANGQPLNDKRNGQATLNKWEKQNQTLRNIQEGIKKTKSAIENEEGKIIDSHATKEKLPKEITNLLDSGGLVQWRKYPNTFFVEGVDKGRISWDFKKGVLSHKYLSSITDPEQRKKFAKAYNTLHTALGMGSGKDGK